MLHLVAPEREFWQANTVVALGYRVHSAGHVDTCGAAGRVVNGKYQIPDLPGIGQELTDECIAESPKVTVK